MNINATHAYSFQNENEHRRQLKLELGRKQNTLEPVVIISPSGKRFNLTVSDDGELGATPL